MKKLKEGAFENVFNFSSFLCHSDGCSACFFASFDKADRDHAAKVCEGLGASLAVVQNKEQNFYRSLNQKFGV